MRFCPLAHVEIPCSEAAPLCPWCALKEQAVYSPPPIEIAAPASTLQRQCIDCGAEYVASGNHQQRCPACRMARERAQNARYQAEHRQRQRERVKT